MHIYELFLANISIIILANTSLNSNKQKMIKKRGNVEGKRFRTNGFLR